MKHYQKLYYKHFYAQDENGEYIPVSKKVCFAPAEEPDTTNPYKQRWFYDQEAGYAVRLARTSDGDKLGRRNAADLKAAERYEIKRASRSCSADLSKSRKASQRSCRRAINDRRFTRQNKILMIMRRTTNMSKNVTNPMKVITGPNTRWSYVNAWEPKSINGGTPKYSVSLIIPKSDTKTLEKIKAALDAAYHEGEAKLRGNGKSVPPMTSLKLPLRDGDTERPDDEAYRNSYFINANATNAPGIVDADRNEILTRSEVYSGVYGRASITFYAFNSNGNRGIACGLNNLQKLRDGEPLGGRASAESDFSTDDDEDFLA